MNVIRIVQVVGLSVSLAACGSPDGGSLVRDGDQAVCDAAHEKWQAAAVRYKMASAKNPGHPATIARRKERMDEALDEYGAGCDVLTGLPS
jgi:hypothetical protein